MRPTIRDEAASGRAARSWLPPSGPYLMALALADGLPAASGSIAYAPAFDGLG